uniref:Uncharacterized protein n=1 Tax=Anopheles atroparvus TaxID=41427 RepID=A0A182JCF8_ANOAO
MNATDAFLEWTEAWSSFMRLHLLQQRRYRKRIWMRPMLLERNQNASNLLRKILEEELDNTIINFMRVSRADFDYLLTIITPKIRKQDTYMRFAITARDKLIITLRFLGAGDNYKSLEYAYRSADRVEWLTVLGHGLTAVLAAVKGHGWTVLAVMKVCGWTVLAVVKVHGLMVLAVVKVHGLMVLAVMKVFGWTVLAVVKVCGLMVRTVVKVRGLL